MPSFKCLLLDIEGTIASISFVKDNLFPYAREHVEEFLRRNLENPDIQKVIVALIELSAAEAEKDSNISFVEPDNVVEGLTKHVRYWIDQDKKLTAMKELQGHIWKEGYAAGELKSHLYEDVLISLRRINLPTYIYSSGSVTAQKLLFAHTHFGDITPDLKGYFDTTVGMKGDSTSYEKICESIGFQPADVMFLSDVEAEVRAARTAGLQTALVIREGNAPLSESAKTDFTCIHSLEELH